MNKQSTLIKNWKLIFCIKFDKTMCLRLNPAKLRFNGNKRCRKKFYDGLDPDVMISQFADYLRIATS